MDAEYPFVWNVKVKVSAWSELTRQVISVTGPGYTIVGPQMIATAPSLVCELFKIYIHINIFIYTNINIMYYICPIVDHEGIFSRMLLYHCTNENLQYQLSAEGLR